MGNRCPNLKSVDLSECSFVTDEGLTRLIQVSCGYCYLMILNNVVMTVMVVVVMMVEVMLMVLVMVIVMVIGVGDVDGNK